jgi:DNA-binding LacI/PurR family transcriptional regulator
MRTVKQLESEISSKIEKGFYDGKKQFPSLKKISEEYSVSFALARKAISMLQDEGVLVSFRGSGTFLAKGLDFPNRKTTRMIGLGVFSYAFLKDLSNEWLEKDWILTHYNAQEDAQDTKREEKFLKGAFQGGFAGVALHPTPLGNTNFDLYRRLQKDGMKIVFLSTLPEKQIHDCCFLLNHKHAGYQSIVQMALKGYQKFVYSHTSAWSAYKELHLSGMHKAAEEYGLQLLEKIVMPKWKAETDTFEKRMEMLVEQNHSLTEQFKKLPDNTAILVDKDDTAEVIRRLMIIAGRKVPEEIGICHCFREWSRELDISGTEFSEREQIQSALEFIADAKYTSRDKYQRWFQPTFVNKKTTR